MHTHWLQFVPNVNPTSEDINLHIIISELRSCVNIEVAVLGSPSLRAISVDVRSQYIKHH